MSRTCPYIIRAQGCVRYLAASHDGYLQTADRVVGVPGHDFHSVEVSDGLHQSSGAVVLMDAGQNGAEPKYKWLPIG